MKRKILSYTSLFVLVSLTVMSGVYVKPNTVSAVGGSTGCVGEGSISIDSVAPSFAVAPNDPFNIEARIDWTTFEPYGGSINYIVTLSQEGTLLRTWTAQSPGNQPIDTISYPFPSGITSDTNFNITASFDTQYSGYCTESKDFTVTVLHLTNNPAGTIDVTPIECVITNGSTCPVSLNWTTQNLISGAPTEVTHNNPDHSHVSYLTSGNNFNTAVNYGKTRLFLYHNGTELAQTVEVNASCPFGMNWNGSECSFAPAPTGTIQASDNCTITSGTTCPATVNWTTQNLVSGKPTEVTHDNPDHSHVSYLTEGTETVPISTTTTFYLYHNGLELAHATTTVNNPAPVNRRWDWGAWGACFNGRQTRTAVCTPPVNGGLECEATPPAPYDKPQSKICGGGACSVPADHTNPCSDGIPSSITNGISKWAWTCVSRDDNPAHDAHCTELKKKPIVKEL